MLLVAGLFVEGNSFAQEFMKGAFYSASEYVHEVNGISVADFNRDGYLQVFIVSARSFDANDPATWNRLMQGSEDGLVDMTVALGFENQYKDGVEAMLGTKIGASGYYSRQKF